MTAMNMEIRGIARRFRPAAAFASMVLFACTLQGTSITLLSSSATVQNNAGMATINIVQNPVWATPIGASSWISFTTTGDPADSHFIQLPNLMVVSFTDTFNLDGPVTFASLDVLADDTTDVIINGHMILAQTTSLGPHCTSLPVGCLSNTTGHLQTSDFASFWKIGQNTLQFDTVQLGNQSFGLDFAASINTSVTAPSIPEPSAAVLGGSGLLGLVLFAIARRRAHKSI